MVYAIKKIPIITFITIIIVVIIFSFINREKLFSYINNDKKISDKAGYNEKPVKVITQNIELTPNNHTFEAVGTGKAKQSVNIYSSVSEEVTGVFFNAGDNVEKGKVLAQLDDREEKLALKLAEVKLQDSKSLLNRYEQAVKEGAVPESEVDSARADVDSADVALEQARLALIERKIIAPYSGVVGISRVDPGDRVNSDTLITGLDDRKTIYVDFEVPEALAGALNSEQTIIATTPAYPEHQFSGRITSLESRVDPERRTIMTRASIENIDDLLRPGMSFTTKWEIKGSEYPTVPEIALQWSGDNSFVWVIRNGKSQKISAQIIARRSGMVLLKGDISKGEPIVVEGLERLREGAKVKILGEDQTELEIQVQK